MFEFKHPKYYKELRKRNKLDQVISRGDATAAGRRAPGPGLKQQAIEESVPYTDVIEAQASSESKPEPSSGSEASSHKRQAQKHKL